MLSRHLKVLSNVLKTGEGRERQYTNVETGGFVLCISFLISGWAFLLEHSDEYTDENNIEKNIKERRIVLGATSVT